MFVALVNRPCGRQCQFPNRRESIHSGQGRLSEKVSSP